MAAAAWNSTAFVEALTSYGSYANKEVERVRRNLFGLSDDDQAELTWKPRDQVEAIEAGVKANLEFLRQLADLIKTAPGPLLDGRTKLEAPQGSKPVQVLLQTFTREWTEEGLGERQECHDMILAALDTVQKDAAGAGSKPRALVPGASLGRLAFDIQKRGFETSACEARVLQYYGAELLRRTGKQREVHKLQPFALNTCNRFRQKDHVRVTAVPEEEISEGSLPDIKFGDFLRLYDSPKEKAAYDALATAFTVDCSPNVLRFVRTAAHVVRPGGVWANFGPLAYDTEHDEGHGHGLELSWEELRYAISLYFDVQEEKFVDSLQASNAASMMQIQYSCIFFRAVRNNEEAAGIGIEAR